MTPFLERIREWLETVAFRLRESPRLLLAAVAAALAIGTLVGRWTAPVRTPAVEPGATVAAPPKATDFESLVAADSPFETSRQGEQKRLVALQNTLAAAISEFDGVGKASVFIAPRSPVAGLGPAASSRTASVHLTMEAGRRLDDGQVEAIARLVAGAETGLHPESVAIVDGSGPRATTAAGFDAAAVERLVRERLAVLLPAGTVPEVSVAARNPAKTEAQTEDATSLPAIDVAIAIPDAYFVAAHAMSLDGADSLAGFRVAEAERLALAARRSLEAALDPATARIASCRVDWTFAAIPGDLAPEGTAAWVRPLVIASLGAVAAIALGLPWWRARRRGNPVTRVPVDAVETKPTGSEIDEFIRRDPAEAARALDRWVRGGAA